MGEGMTANIQYTAERFADIQMLRYRLSGFESLTLNQKLYIYYLSKATLAGRNITFDQFGEANLTIRRTLEAIYLHYTGDRSTDEFLSLEEYLKQVWFASGIHHHYNKTKFIPRFSESFFHQAVRKTPAEHFSFFTGSVEGLIDYLTPILFDPTVLPKRKCTYYQGATLQEAEKFYATRPFAGLNTTLIKEGDSFREYTWKLGGKYSREIQHIIHWLQKAITVAENTAQQEVIRLLIDYYTTGSLSTFDQYNIAWVAQKDGLVDFINGFIEVYADPIGRKGSWEGIVHYKDLEATRRTQKICENAQWFEDHSPIDPRFKKPIVKGITANVVCAAMLGGDEYPASAIGINLPNADHLRAEYGSKSITIGNLTHAYNQASRGSGMREEFIDDSATRTLIERYSDLTDELHTDLHECLGHGSGQLLGGVSPTAIRSYASTLEETRADLFGLYYMADDKLISLGLLPDHEAYKAQYYSYLLNGLLTQMVRIPLGGQLEEAHMQNRAIIARWVMEHSEGCVSLVKKEDKTYLRITDYPRVRTLIATLLAHVQRIKSEGDYTAAKSLVETYGIHLDPTLHSEVLRRYATLNIAPYRGFINPVLTPITNEKGEIIDIRVDYSEDYSSQMLRYSQEY